MLLAAARPGQRTPGLGQAVNLAACGLVIRVRRIPGWLAADAGQDALAVVSLIAPAVVFILLALGRGAMDATAAARVPFWTLLPVLPSSGESVVVMIAWLAVVLLGLTGCRRSSRGDRVHLADARLAGCADRESCSRAVPGPEGFSSSWPRLTSLSSWPAWRLARWPCPPARGGAWRSWGGGEPAS